MNEPLTQTAIDAILEHMNDDHADAIASYARAFAGFPDARSARMKGMDAAGMELDIVTDAGMQTARVPFDHPLADAEDAKQTLILMARQAG